MKKVIAALVAAAFSITVAGTAMAAPAQVNQQHSSITKVQSDQGTTKKKSTKKKACRVPRVRGLPVRKARKKLRRARCRYRVRGKGRVVSVRPRAGIRTRSTVQLRARRSAR